MGEMRCLKCGYALGGLPVHVCPECGAPFDPQDVAMLAQVHGLPRWYHRGAIIVAAWPLGILGMLHAVYMVGRALDSNPRGSLGTALSLLTFGSFLITPLALFVVIALLCSGEGQAIWTKTERGRRCGLAYVLLALVGWSLAVLWLVRDPFGMIAWILSD